MPACRRLLCHWGILSINIISGCMNTIFTDLKTKIFVFLLLFFGCLAGAWAQGQTYGNEWINFSQPYYKIKVTRNGMHRIDFNYLSATGLAGANPQKIQVFRRGKELAVSVNGEGDGKLDAGDYLEFYGERNDGKTDVELYQNRADKVHDYYSFYTDTAAYFLTVSTVNGKRMQNQSLPATNLNPTTWHLQTRLALYTGSYTRAKAYNEVNMPWGDQSEGFFSDYFGVLAGNRDRLNPYTFQVDSLLNVEPTGPQPVVEIALVGPYYRDHDVTISIVAPSGAERILQANLKYGGWEHIKVKYPINFNEIQPNGNLAVRIKVNSQVPAGSIADLIRVAYIKVQYPRKNIMGTGDLKIALPDSSKTTPSFLPFDNLAPNAVAYDFTDKENIARLEPQTLNGLRGFVVPGTGRQHQLLVTTITKYFNPLPANRRVFKQFDVTKPNYIIISHRKLTSAAAPYTNPVKAYADYRASAVGGKYDTLVFYSDQVYDQFHYGDHSAVAIRRLMQYLLARGKPKYLFLLGKGVEIDYGGGDFRRNPFNYPVQDLVPTGGAPGSDIIFTADFQNKSYAPRVATGRLAAVSAAEVAGYLDKIKQHEAVPQNAEWRKNILHLGGGVNQTEQTLFRNYLRSYETLAEGPLFGGEVETITRSGSTSATVNINVSTQLNAGLSLITFFGHSAPSTTDIDIGYASVPVNNYNNPGKYPLILLNGCYSGNAFSPIRERSIGEDWILTPRRGAIAFIAHSATGLTSPLNAYSRNFYATAFTDPDFYGKPVGIINQEAVRRTAQSGNELLVATATSMVLQADPAVVIVGPEKPDYAIKGSDVTITAENDQETLTAASESFKLLIPVKNLGKATQQPFKISVTRNNRTVITSDFYPAIYNHETITFVFNSPESKQAGINTFKVVVDSENSVEELDESNNTATFDFNFPTTGAKPLLPVEFAIVNAAQVKLIGQANDLFQKEKDYEFQLDTTHTFNSPARRIEIVKGSSLPTWAVTLPAQVSPRDSVVYFWRFRLKESVSPEDTIWGTSSFRYIPASPDGWSQSHPGQLLHAQATQVNLDADTRQWNFAPISKNLSLRTAAGTITANSARYGIYVNNFNQSAGSCVLNIPNILVAVFNDKTLESYKMPASLGASLCGEAPQSLYYFGDLRQASRRQNLQAFLEAVPAGYYVALVTLNEVPFNDFSPELKNAFRALGSKLITDLPAGAPFALVGRQGMAAGTAEEITHTGTEPNESIELNFNIVGRGNNGKIVSTLIGPVTAWNTLYHTVHNSEQGRDRYTLSVVGYDIEGKNEKVLIPAVTNRALDLSGLVDAKTYPFIQLSLNVSDSLDASAPQLKEWLVTYTGVPEGVFRPDVVGIDKYATYSAQAAKGKIDAQFAFQNISPYSFGDSLLARISLIGTNGFNKEFSVKAILKEQTLTIPYTFATSNLTGNYTLRVTVNPLGQNRLLRPEQYYFNNTIEVPFVINANVHPVLDVVFDGRHILDGDIVSPNPLISMSIKDEDKFTFLKDPSHMEVYIKAPGAAGYEQINLAGNGDIKYFAADKNNDFKLEYAPKNLPDGVYSLRVQGKDIAENLSGFEPYTISFEVINESSITHFYPYPNPFSSKTKFVFTLTGNTVPEQMKIQIMTITGKIVREIMKEELGPLKIGNNISDFAWDGTDEFGDKLANGVYLYRVIMDTGQEEFKRRNTAGDAAFKKDYGKIYILR